MSFYKDIYNDYPIRCGKLWTKLRPQALNYKLDVTFMLMAAAGGLGAPWEHLKIQAGQSDSNKNHPAFFKYDASHYKKVLETIETALRGEVANCPLFAEGNFDKWFFAKVENLNQIRDCVESRNRSGNVLKTQNARFAIKIFRNALAHNNIHAFNRNGVEEIDEIAFFSENRIDVKGSKETKIDGYHVLALPHVDFALFLDSWFKLLNDVDPRATCLRMVIPETLAKDDISDAA